MKINSLKNLLDLKIEDIDDSVIQSGLELFGNVHETECKFAIMRILTSVLMSGKMCSDDTIIKYNQGCELYLKHVCRLIRRPTIKDWDKFAIENSVYILYTCKFYCSYQEPNDEMQNIIFKIMTNLAYKDIINKYFVDYAFSCYKEVNEGVRVNIVYFLQNVYLDDDWIDDDEFIEKYRECITHFIRTYYIIHPYLSMELLTDARMLFPINREWIDLILSLTEQNVENYETFEKCIIYLNSISNSWMMDYIVQSPIVKMIVNKALNTNDDTIIYLLTNMFLTFTSSEETEVPCEFYYKYIFHRMIVQEKMLDVYPRHILFSLSNIVCTNTNIKFINVNDILSYITYVIRNYNEIECALDTDIYYLIENLRVLISFKEILAHKEFMDAYAMWIQYNGNIKIYRITRMMFHYIAYNPEFHYLYKSTLSEKVLELANKSYMYKRLVNRYMNFTLEQKCAKLLHKMGKIDDNDLEVLDITIY